MQFLTHLQLTDLAYIPALYRVGVSEWFSENCSLIRWSLHSRKQGYDNLCSEEMPQSSEVQLSLDACRPAFIQIPIKITRLDAMSASYPL